MWQRSLAGAARMMCSMYLPHHEYVLSNISGEIDISFKGTLTNYNYMFVNVNINLVNTVDVY